MAANTSPIFALTPKIGRAVLAAANTARDGTGTLELVLTVGSNGGRLDGIKWTSSQVTAAALSQQNMVIRVWVCDTGGTNPVLLVEGLISSTDASSTVIGAWGYFDFMNGIYSNNFFNYGIGIVGGFILDATKELRVTQSIYAGVSDRAVVIAKYGDF